MTSQSDDSRGANDIAARARARFAALRRAAAEGPGCTPVDEPPPAGWCVSAIARLEVNDRALCAVVADVQARVRSMVSAYLYPPESLHISLLGCTQREASRPAAQSARVANLARAIGQLAHDSASVPVHLASVNLIGTQLFVEVVPSTQQWPRMREQLAVAARDLGEDPIFYKDSEPMHLNIARFETSVPRPVIAELLRFHLDEPLVIDTLEAVITDFLVTPDTTETLGRHGL